MVCLVDSFEVICFHHDVNFKIVSVYFLIFRSQTDAQIPCPPKRRIRLSTPSFDKSAHDQESDI